MRIKSEEQMRGLIRKRCVLCGDYFNTNFKSAKYCSPECYKDVCNKKRLETAKRFHIERKLKVLKKYSGEHPECACCGENHVEFLGIDHIDGCGSEHLKELRNKKITLYQWLIKSNFPEGFQVLCLNCNMVKGRHKQRFCYVHHPELYE